MHPLDVEYDEILRLVKKGHIAAFAPAYTADGRPSACHVVDRHPLSHFHLERLHQATRDELVRHAIAVVAQLRRHYGLG